MALSSVRGVPGLSMSRPLAQLSPQASKQSTPYPKPPQINDAAVASAANNQQAMATAQSYEASGRVGAKGVSSGKAKNYYDDYTQQMGNVGGQMQAAQTNQQAANANTMANYQAKMLHENEKLGYGGMLEGLRQIKKQGQLQNQMMGNQYRNMMHQNRFHMDQTKFTDPRSMIDALFR